MSSKHNVILHNIGTSKRQQKFLGKSRQKYYNLEFMARSPQNFLKTVANRWKLKVAKF